MIFQFFSSRPDAADEDHLVRSSSSQDLGIIISNNVTPVHRGGAFSLAVKPGWGRPQGAEGAGW